MIEENKCEGCGGEPSAELHTCPYRDEIGPPKGWGPCDPYLKCNCCDSCQKSCAMDI